MEKHYICLGGCKGVSQVPGVCQAENCINHNHNLVECNCVDDLHNNFKQKSHSFSHGFNKKIIIVIIFLLLVFGIYYFLFSERQTLSLQSVQNLQEKQEISVEGIYIKNTRDEDEGLADGGSYQVIDTKDYGQIQVVVGGFRANCLAKEIYQPLKGDKVEVYGMVISDPNNNFFNGNQMSVCSSEKYYIKKAYTGSEEKELQANCVDNDKYFIVSREASDYVGSDISIKYKSSPSQNISCEYVKEKSDVEILNHESANFIIALEGKYLLLDSGTGPDPRGLSVYDLEKQKEIFSDKYSQPVEVGNLAVSYWTESSVKANKDNCPDFFKYQSYGGSSAIDKHVKLDLSTLVKKDLGETKCSYRQ